MPESGRAEHVLQRHPLRPELDQFLVSKQLIAAHGVDEHQPSTTHPEHVRGEQLGIDAWRRDPCLGQTSGGSRQSGAQSSPVRPLGGVFVRECHGIIMGRRIAATTGRVVDR
ncbi:hypothetical protein GCM10010435_14190 [Winogradskya consettensis]|uniref:Uncharacterized protein n=1 Tax=Winogradskya consettensis TaxID=113560 RepID=A0A919SCC3_9ACTN|nr:hypothetical protein Aco04nite_13460 [Actinoplanes consettensis]